MARGPAVVIVARHGARLDAADKQWHLTSPAPYDPPLTYGGWSQGKALGLRIAALLHQRERDRASPSDPASSPPAKPKHKIILHSSPFLRCVQTSTAIAAGLSQFQAPTQGPPPTPTSLDLPAPQRERERSPLGPSPSTVPVPDKLQPSPDGHKSPPRPQKSGWLRLTNPAVNSKPYIGPEKILLRIDAFLGEWLSPDYYEDITPPPNSTMMVAGAKADLLRRSDYIEAPSHKPTSMGHFPGGWVRSNATSAVNSRSSSRQNTQHGQFPTLGSLAQALPQRERSNSHGSMLTRQRSRSQEPHMPVELAAAHKKNSHLYDAPNPSYAVSPSDPIPRGYAKHARDACLKVDYQWDSMREPQQWGDGGQFGDEWSTMHKRFRRGLAGMMQWYREHGTRTLPPQNMFPGFTFTERTTSATKKIVPSLEPKDDVVNEDDDEELVLILITHGAGCNALLGAITNQPVLMDISLASLSMAVRREIPRPSSASTVFARRSSVIDPGMADSYEMKLMASIDHLRPGVDPSKLPHTQSPAIVVKPSVGHDYRPPRRLATISSASTSVEQVTSPSSLGPPARPGWTGSLDSMQRTSTSKEIPGPNSLSAGATSSNVGGGSGLWGGALKSTNLNETQQDRRASPGTDTVEAFNSHPKAPSHGINSQPSVAGNTSDPPYVLLTDGAASPNVTEIKGHEDNEKHDGIAPLFVSKRASTMSKTNGGGTATNTGGLWGAPKKETSTNGLWKGSSVMWGPPKLDDIYEHGRGPKRRWTMTERG